MRIICILNKGFEIYKYINKMVIKLNNLNDSNKLK